MKLNPDTTRRLLRAAVQVTIGVSISYLLYAWAVGTIETATLLLIITLGNTGLLVYVHKERVF